MEFPTQYRDDLAFRPTILPENYMNPGFGFGFPLDSLFSSNGYLQDFHPFDQFHVDGLSWNSKFGVLPTYFDQFKNFADGSSSFNISDSMPFIEDGAMEKFQNISFMNCPQRIPSDQDNNYSSSNFRELESRNLAFLPEQMSCITAENRFCWKMGMIRKSLQMRRTSKAKTKANMIKGQWTTKEDSLLVSLVSNHGVKNWSDIAQMLPGRIGKQCRERWLNHLRPNIKKDTWTEEEDMILIEAHAQLGNKWAEIAKKLRGRTENTIKNHWNATKRRLLSRKIYRSSKHKNSSSLLQNYIKHLIATSNIADYESNANMMSVNAIGGPSTQLESSADLCAADHLVPNYYFSNPPDFSFYMKMLFDEMPDTSVVDESSLEVEMPLDMDALVQYEVKREMDLVEMIAQTKI